MYRMQLKHFLLVQPVVLLASLPYEWIFCQWAAVNHPNASGVVFGAAADWGRVLMGVGTPHLVVPGAFGGSTAAEGALGWSLCKSALALIMR